MIVTVFELTQTLLSVTETVYVPAHNPVASPKDYFELAPDLMDLSKHNPWTNRSCRCQSCSSCTRPKTQNICLSHGRWCAARHRSAKLICVILTSNTCPVSVSPSELVLIDILRLGHAQVGASYVQQSPGTSSGNCRIPKVICKYPVRSSRSNRSKSTHHPQPLNLLPQYQPYPLPPGGGA